MLLSAKNKKIVAVKSVNIFKSPLPEKYLGVVLLVLEYRIAILLLLIKKYNMQYIFIIKD